VHNITADNGSFTTGAIAPGATSSPIVMVTADVSYHCSIHPSMVGSLSASAAGGGGGGGGGGGY
jgi:hypothetical protein